MIPLRDTVSSKNIPVATYFIIGLNIFVFLLQPSAGHGERQFIYLYGLVPAKFTVHKFAVWFSLSNKLFSFVSYMFLHGGFWHILGNMWFLYIFGDNVEDYFGSLRFLWFYILCGIAAAFFHILLNPVSQVPTIGASGAIAGVMGAYFILHPKAKILTLIPIIIIPFFFEIPAFIFLGFWFIIQFFNAAGSSAGAAGAGIAWWAHVGGFLSGMMMVKLNRRIPETGAGIKLKTFTEKKKTPRLQVIHSRAVDDSGDLFGEIEITSIEALTGTKKIVNIPWGFHRNLYRVIVPAGVKNGTMLRLAGMGKISQRGSRGDLYLKVKIRDGF